MASIKKRPNGMYRARYRDDRGKEHARHFEKRKDAQTWLDQVASDRLQGVHVDPKAGRTRFGPFAEDWLASRTVEATTLDTMRSRFNVHILPRFGDVELGKIRPSHVQAWLAGLQTTLAPTTVRTMLANLSAIFEAAVDDGMIRRNPCSSKSVSAPRAPDKLIVPWTVDQVLAVIDAHPAPYRSIPAVAAGAGLRQGETFGLRRQDVDWLGVDRKLRVRQQVRIEAGQLTFAPPKGGKEREVPLADYVAEALAVRMEGFAPLEDGLIFYSRERKPINRNYFNDYVWKPALRRAGVPPTRENGMHALRHFYASVQLDGGVSIRALASYLGHADPGFTLRTYTHLMPTTEGRARAAVDAKLGRSADSVRTAGAEHA